MEFTGLDFYFLMIFPVIYVKAGLNLEKDNVCLKTITYHETIKSTVSRPVPKRDAVKCLKEGKYCDEEITTDTKEPRVITRTKIVPSCCEGYKEDTEGTQCEPVCPNGCGSGKCVAPGKCSCESGYHGPECGKICDVGRWGENCIHECNCSEKEECDKVSGCVCKSGWTEDRCATPCPEGYYGIHCEKKCRCDVHFCDPATGACIKSKEEGEGIKQEPKASTNANVVTNETSVVVNNSEDFVPLETNSSTNASEKEKVFTALSERDEVTTHETTYFKSEDAEKTEGPAVGKTNFKSVLNLEGGVRHGGKSTTFNTLEDIKRTDILRNLSAFGENFFQGNELFSLAGDSQTTASGSVKSSRVGNFIPTFTVLSGVTVLILLIAGKWFIITVRNKVRKMANVESGCSDEELSILSTEKFTWESNLDSPLYVSDILKGTPILQTFKPGTEDIENKSAAEKNQPGS